MFTLKKQFRFEAAHQLPSHDGKCARLHGHSWVGWVVIKGKTLYDSGPKEGMLVDYNDLKKAVQPLVEDYLDHHHLNATLDMEAPTSEAIAQWLYGQLKQTQVGPYLDSVVIEETCTSSCEYRERP